MAVTPLGYGLIPVTEPKHVIERVVNSGGEVFRGQLVIAASGIRCDGRADASTAKCIGVALNYAGAGEKCLICDDPAQRYAVAVTAIPLALGSQIGYYADTSGAGSAQSGAPHRDAGVLNAGTMAAIATTALPLQVVGIHEIEGNPFGDGTGSGSVKNIVEVVINNKEYHTPYNDI